MFGIERLTARVARLEQTARRQDAVIAELCERLGIEPPVLDPVLSLDETERDLVARGKKVQAMRHHRERTGSGLVEAKDAVERG